MGMGSFFLFLMPYTVSAQNQTTQKVIQTTDTIDVTTAGKIDQSVVKKMGIHAIFLDTHFFVTPPGKMHEIFMAVLAEGNDENGYVQVGYTFRSEISENDKKVLLYRLPGTNFKVFDLSQFTSTEQYNDSIKSFWEENGFNVTGINDKFSEKPGVTVFPNPTTGELNFNSLKVLSEIVIYDIWGRKVYAEKIVKATKTIRFNISSLPPGVYLIKTFGLKGKLVSTEKIVKR